MTATARGEQNARTLVGVAATLGVLGVAFNVGGEDTLPKLLGVVGLVALVWAIHRFGRLGPDAPLVFEVAEDAPAPKRRRKKKRREPGCSEPGPAPSDPNERASSSDPDPQS